MYMETLLIRTMALAMTLLALHQPLRSQTTPCVEQNLSEVAPGSCLDKEVVAIDAELNREYQQTLRSLPAEQQTLLRASERDWIRCRDADLALFESFVRGNHPTTIVKTEQVRVIRDRIKLLQGYRG